MQRSEKINSINSINQSHWCIKNKKVIFLFNSYFQIQISWWTTKYRTKILQYPCKTGLFTLSLYILTFNESISSLVKYKNYIRFLPILTISMAWLQRILCELVSRMQWKVIKSSNSLFKFQINFTLHQSLERKLWWSCNLDSTQNILIKR